MTRRAILLPALAAVAAVVWAVPSSGRSGSPAADPDAETLFRRMEEVLVKAKTLSVSFDGTFEGTIRGRLNGALVCSTGNKSREEIEGDLAFGRGAKKPVAIRMISDGTKMATTTGLGVNPYDQTLDVPKHLAAAHRLFLARAGVICPTYLLAEHVRPGEAPPDRAPEEYVRVGEFRLGGVEKVGGREARVVRHTLTSRTFKEPLAVTLWIDAKTDLPVKRIVAFEQAGLTGTLTETYSDLTLDQKVDDKQFDLTKE